VLIHRRRSLPGATGELAGKATGQPYWKAAMVIKMSRYQCGIINARTINDQIKKKQLDNYIEKTRYCR
jgi:hypothetical protein